MTNKIVILAAGKATRMLELGKDKPKHLINIKQRPFLYYSLTNIAQVGFKEIIIVVGHKKEKMEQFAKEYRQEFNLTLVDQFKIIGTEKYGTACAIECVESNIDNQDFVVINGDDLYSIEDMKKIKNLDHHLCHIGGFKSEQPQHYGLLKLDQNNYLRKIVEKPKPGIDFDPKKPLKNLINIGLYKFTPDIFKAIKKINLSERGEYEITDAITLLAQQKKVKVVPIHDYWLSFTNPDDIAKVEFFLNNK